MSDMEAIVAKLNRSRAGLLSAVERVPAGRWQKRPGNGAWSAAEVVAHLTMVETAVVSGVTKWVQTEPKPVPFWKRLHIPPALGVLRLVKVKSPIPLDASLVGEKDAMLERYRTVREQTLVFVESNRERDLRRWRRPHPFMGSFNGNTWLKFIGCHEARHTKQIREIVKSL